MQIKNIILSAVAVALTVANDPSIGDGATTDVTGAASGAKDVYTAPRAVDFENCQGKIADYDKKFAEFKERNGPDSTFKADDSVMSAIADCDACFARAFYFDCEPKGETSYNIGQVPEEDLDCYKKSFEKCNPDAPFDKSVPEVAAPKADGVSSA